MIDINDMLYLSKLLHCKPPLVYPPLRQDVDRAADRLEQAAIGLKEIKSIVEGLLMEWDKFDKYGSQIVKDTFMPRIALVRTWLEKQQ